MPIKKSNLYSSIWKSCDELRGGMDASQNKDYPGWCPLAGLLYASGLSLSRCHWMDRAISRRWLVREEALAAVGPRLCPWAGRVSTGDQPASRHLTSNSGSSALGFANGRRHLRG